MTACLLSVSALPWGMLFRPQEKQTSKRQSTSFQYLVAACLFHSLMFACSSTGGQWQKPHTAGLAFWPGRGVEEHAVVTGKTLPWSGEEGSLWVIWTAKLAPQIVFSNGRFDVFITSWITFISFSFLTWKKLKTRKRTKIGSLIFKKYSSQK